MLPPRQLNTAKNKLSINLGLLNILLCKLEWLDLLDRK